MSTINKHDFSEDLVWIGFLITDEKGIGIRFNTKRLCENPTRPIYLMKEMSIFKLMEEIESNKFLIFAEICNPWVINGWRKTTEEVDEVDKIIFLQFILEMEKVQGVFNNEEKEKNILFIKKYLRKFFK